MSSEKLYTETEAVEIIQRALNKPDIESPVNGLTKEDLWRIAKEAGASRSQFDAALASTRSKTVDTLPRGLLGNSHFSSIVAGELTSDDFIVIDESISPNFGGKTISQDGHLMNIKLEQGLSLIYAVIASRKGQTSIRVRSALDSIFVVAFILMTFVELAGVIAFGKGHSHLAWSLIILAPLLAAYMIIRLVGFTRKRTKEVSSLLNQLVSEAVAEKINEEGATATNGLPHQDESMPVVKQDA